MSSEEPLSPAEQAVRRLLADARHDEPMPPEVAARLDAVLGALAADDGAAEGGRGEAGEGTVTDLAARRRRRRRVWVAAAAVVTVVGLGGTLVQQDAVTSMTTGADSAGSAASTEDRVAESTPESAPEPGPARGTTSATVPPVARLGPGSLEPQLRRLLASPAVVAQPASPREARTCGAVPGPRDRVLPVTWAGEPAVAVVGPTTATGTLVDVVVCGRAGVVRSVLVGPGRP